MRSHKDRIELATAIRDYIEIPQSEVTSSSGAGNRSR
jgi:hypothetical protein